MDGLSRHHRLSCRPHLRTVKKNWRGRHIQRGQSRNNLLCRLEVTALLTAVRGGGHSFLQVCVPLPRQVRVQHCLLRQHVRA